MNRLSYIQKVISTSSFQIFTFFSIFHSLWYFFYFFNPSFQHNCFFISYNVRYRKGGDDTELKDDEDQTLLAETPSPGLIDVKVGMATTTFLVLNLVTCTVMILV